MTKSGQDDSRRSRWVWERDDVVIIKKGDEQVQTAPDQTKGETPTSNDQASDQTPGKDHESKKR